MEIRTLESLEKAIDVVKKNGFEAYMPQEMAAANKMLLSLKRLKRLKDEILNLKQSTVAEIRSYSKPPAQVHKVMIATYILLGNKESELKVRNCQMGISKRIMAGTCILVGNDERCIVGKGQSWMGIKQL